MTTKALFFRLLASAARMPITLVHQVPSFSAAAIIAISLAIVSAAASAPTAAAQTVTYAGTGAVNFGSANVCPSGKTAPAPCSKTLTLSYKVIESGTLGTPKALTTGAPDLDYKLASGSTCTGSVSKGNTCTVNVTFAPIVPGARNGAVEIVSASGKVLATTYIYGTGVGPRLGFADGGPPTAVDGYGNYFVSASGPEGEDGYVEEWLAVNGTVPPNPVVKILAQAQGLDAYPSSITVDGAGNVFFTVSEYTGSSGGLGYVEKLLAADGYATSSILGGSIQAPLGVTVDGSGNVFVLENFVSDSGDGRTTGIFEILAAGGYTTVNTLGGGSQLIPFAIALDASQNLFVANAFGQNGNLLEFTPSDGYTTPRTINAEVPYYGGDEEAISLDPAGDMFGPSADGHGQTAEFLAVNGVLPANPVSRLVPNIYPGQPWTPPTLSFAQTLLGHSSSDSPQSVAIQNEGNAPLDLSALSLDNPNWSLVKGSGSPEDCAASTSLIPSALCNISISFKPTGAGPLTGAIEVADNSLNAPGSQHSIPLEGFGDTSAPPQITNLNTGYAAPYSVVILYGKNFGAIQGSSTVTFNGIATPHYHWADTKIYVTVPPSATSGNLVVTVGGEVSNPLYFTIVLTPVVTSISPTSGPAGTLVQINGDNLLDYFTGGDIVTFNGVPLQVETARSNLLTVTVPAGAVTGHFHLLANDTGLNSPTFTVTK